MDKTTGRSRRLMITKNSILLLVMLVIVFMAIWAWYLDPHAPVSAGTSQITAASANGVELAIPVKVAGDTTDYFPKDNALWKQTIDFNETGYLKNLVNDVTSNGEQFVVPNFEAAAGLEQGRKVIPDDVWISGLSSKEALNNDIANDDDQYNYISLDFYARSKINSFQVTGGSYLAAGSELGVNENGVIDENNPEKKPLKGDDIYRVSSYGAAKGTSNAFSADAIVGAMRVSLQGQPVSSISTLDNIKFTDNISGENYSPTLRFLWLPRPDIFLKTDDSSNNWRLYTGIKPSDNYADKSYAHTFYKGKYVNGSGTYVDNDSSDPAHPFVKKKVEKNLYYDDIVKNGYSGDQTLTVSNPGIFKVTKIAADDTNVGTTGYTPTLNQSQPIAGDDDTVNDIRFTADSTDRAITGYYVYKYTLNLWIEGEDAEARRSMNEGLFSLHLEFGTS